jgi:hypothetical protein
MFFVNNLSVYKVAQLILGHPRRQRRSDVRTTMVYTHVLKRGLAGVRSPIDGF